ncbi:MAG: isoprenylcysteine carboxylmethyltransferase family protein [Acetobacteraceae bacterium]|nr:isoprenylcysteine carboxylmethyltransferase family protein [Acetobacteraceae bacterium]
MAGERNGATRIVKVMLLAAGGVLVPLALAILGRGGFAAFFGVPALALLAAGTLALAFASGFTGVSLGGGLREDRGNRWVLAVFALLALPFAFLPAWTDRHDLWTIDWEATRWMGLALYLGGGGVRLAAVFALGARFSPVVAIQPGHQLETRGLYRLVRHPSYTGLLVNALGWALAFRSALGLVLAALLFLPLLGRMRAEEAFLAAEFGPEYEAYRAHTWRLVPWVY